MNWKTKPFQDAWHIAWCDRYIVITVSYQSLIIHCRLLSRAFIGQRTFVLFRLAYYRLVCCIMALSKSNLGLCSSLNFVSLVISAVTLLLLLAGFLRIEVKLNDQDANLAAVERLCIARTQDVSQDGKADVKGKRDDLRVFRRSLIQNTLKYRPR